MSCAATCVSWFVIVIVNVESEPAVTMQSSGVFSIVTRGTATVSVTVDCGAFVFAEHEGLGGPRRGGHAVVLLDVGGVDDLVVGVHGAGLLHVGRAVSVPRPVSPGAIGPGISQRMGPPDTQGTVL